MKTYEFTMDRFSEDMGVCTHDIDDCTEEIIQVCTPEADQEHLFLVGKTDVKVSYNADRQPTIEIGNKVFTPNDHLDYTTDIIHWVLETLDSAASMMLTGRPLKECANEFAYEIREGWDSSLISAKVLIEAYSGTELNQFFNDVRKEFNDMAWLFKPLLWELDRVFFETLVDAGISGDNVARGLTGVYSFDELSQMMQEFNEDGKYEYQIFLAEVLRAIPQEELDKRWEL